MNKIKNNHQAVLMLQSAKNYFEDIAFEANQSPSVISAFAGMIDAVQAFLEPGFDCRKIQKELNKEK